MVDEDGIVNAYRVFNTRTFRQTMSIPDRLWNEMEPIMTDKINELRKKLRMQQSQQKIIKVKTSCLVNTHP